MCSSANSFQGWAANVLLKEGGGLKGSAANLGNEHAVARIFAVVCNLPVIVGKYNC